MASATNNLMVRIVADNTVIKKKLSETAENTKALAQTVEQASRSMERAFKRIGLAVFGYETAKAFKNAISAAIEQESALAKLSAVIDSSSKYTGLNSQRLQEFAEALNRTTIYSDKQVESTMALLGSFKEIQGPIFEKAAKSILDMAAIMGTDLNSAALRFGKALNNPISGLYTLLEIGVSLTEENKAQIRSLMAVNDILSAQNLILDIVAKQYPNISEQMTKTFGGALIRLKNEAVNFQEAIGNMFIKSPAVIALINELRDWLEKLQKEIKNFGIITGQDLLPLISAFSILVNLALLARKSVSGINMLTDLGVGVGAKGLGFFTGAGKANIEAYIEGIKSYISKIKKELSMVISETTRVDLSEQLAILEGNLKRAEIKLNSWYNSQAGKLNQFSADLYNATKARTEDEVKDLKKVEEEYAKLIGFIDRLTIKLLNAPTAPPNIKTPSGGAFTTTTKSSPIDLSAVRARLYDTNIQDEKLLQKELVKEWELHQRINQSISKGVAEAKRSLSEWESRVGLTREEAKARKEKTDIEAAELDAIISMIIEKSLYEDAILKHKEEIYKGYFQKIIDGNAGMYDTLTARLMLWAEETQSTWAKVADTIDNAMTSAVSTFSSAISEAIWVSGNFRDAMINSVRSIAQNITSMLIEFALKKVVTAFLDIPAVLTAHSIKMGAYAAETYGAAFASSVGALGPLAVPYAGSMVASMLQGAAVSAELGQASSSIPGMAEGGMVTSPSVIRVAEREPEIITPISKVVNFLGSPEKSAPTPIILTLNGRELARALVDLTKSGRLPLVLANG